MQHLFRHIRSLLVAITALALSAGLAFGATPEAASWGLANAASHAGKTVPVAGGADTLGEDEDEDEDEEEGEEEDVDEETDEDAEESEDEEAGEASEDAGENCSTDPTLLTEEDLAELNHGSIVCWAAHQDEWPEWFSKHGEFVRCWAHHGKADAPSCTEDPNAEDETTTEEPTVDPSSAKPGKGKGNGGGKGKSKPNRD